MDYNEQIFAIRQSYHFLYLPSVDLEVIFHVESLFGVTENGADGNHYSRSRTKVLNCGQSRKCCSLVVPLPDMRKILGSMPNSAK